MASKLLVCEALRNMLCCEKLTTSARNLKIFSVLLLKTNQPALHVIETNEEKFEP
jgi:hypothetical protein